MQADRWLVQHVKNAAQIRTELRRETDPLRFAAAQGFRRASEREIAKPNIFHEPKALLNLRHEIGGDRLLIPAKLSLPITRALRRPRER